MSDVTHRCVCPGSFDPVTNGHLDIFARAAAQFDEVIVAVLHNPAKRGRFPIQERLEFLRATTADLPGVQIQEFSGRLLVDVCTQVGATAIVKGLRGASDYAYELPMARMNRHLTGVETMFIPADPRFEHVSSSLVSEVAGLGGDIEGLVPDVVLERLRR